MYAIIKSGARQYRVAEGDTIVVNRLPGNVGDKVKFEEVLFVGGAASKVGVPFISGAMVEGVLKEQNLGPKVRIFKYRRRHNYRKAGGHRQTLSTVEVTKIKG